MRYPLHKVQQESLQLTKLEVSALVIRWSFNPSKKENFFIRFSLSRFLMSLKVKFSELILETRGEGDIVNITSKVEEKVKASGTKNGLVNIFIPGSTGAVTTIEYEPGLLKDLPAALERIAPSNVYYEHEKMWHDGNGRSHVRASIIGPSLTIPIKDGKLMLGTWQQVVFLELDIRPRRRSLIVTILGE